MLGSDSRWGLMEQLDEDVDVWDGESEGDSSDSELDGEEEPDDDEDKMIRWRSRRKHFFVLSSAGKPIYSRYGDDSVISGYMGVIQTIISFFEDTGDTLRSFATRTHRFVVIKEGPLYLVAISSLGESESQLRTQLDFLYAQILSTLTLSSLNRAFTSRSNFDLRNLLGGTEIFLDAVADAMIKSDPGILLGALEVSKLRKSTREKINTALLNARHEDLLYGMIVAEGRLVSVIRPRRHSLHPPDMQLLFSMVFNSTSFLNGNEHWIPLCLPKFNAKGFLHAYIWAEDSCAIILISADKNAFFNMREVKEKVHTELVRNGIWDKILTSVRRGRYIMSDVGIPGVLHFIYKSRLQVQYTMPSLPSNDHQSRRLLALYRHLHAVVHAKRAHVKIFHYTSRRFSALVWVGSGFECYVVAEGRVGRGVLARGARGIVRWVRTEEARLFVSGGVVF